MNSTPVVFISILKQVIVSLYSSLNAVRQLQYISALHFTYGNILKYENNLKGLDFSSLLTCRDLHNALTNFHVIYRESPVNISRLEKMFSPFFWNEIYGVLNQTSVKLTIGLNWLR